MRKRLTSIILSVILAICLVFLGLIIYFLVPKECKHHFCKKTDFGATCETKGYTLYECRTCDYVFEADFIAPLGHNYINEIIAPTCEDEGYTLHTCTTCQKVIRDTVVAAVGHKYTQTLIEPTCETQGYTVNSCDRCDFSTTTDYVAPLGHDNVQTTIAPTCEDEGYILTTCNRCDYEYTSHFVSPTGHSYSEIGTLQPTCTVGGNSTYMCNNCEHRYVSDYTDPIGHSYTKTRTVAPTCTEEGYSTYKCTSCNHEYRGDYTDPKGHTLVSTVTAPTCTSEGYTTYSCSNCDHQYIANTVPKEDHTYKKTYVRPNIEQTGYTVFECIVCESKHTGEYVFYSDIFSGSAGTGEGSLALGVDVSHHSYDVDFEALREADVEFVILRVGYHKTLDTKFEEYYAAARAAGLDIGVYFFTLAESKEEAKADADRVAAWLEGKTFEYPIFYDIEDDPHYSGYTPSEFTENQIMEITHTFMTTMVEHGYYPGIYTNNNFLYNVFNNEKTLRLYDVWYARYVTPEDDVTVLPSNEQIVEHSKLYSMWQYKGNVEGYQNGAISGMCDVNFAFKDYPSIIKEFGFNGYDN